MSLTSRMIDPSSGLTQCPGCGRCWWTDTPPRGSRRPRRWWVCPDGCDD